LLLIQTDSFPELTVSFVHSLVSLPRLTKLHASYGKSVKIGQRRFELLFCTLSAHVEPVICSSVAPRRSRVRKPQRRSRHRIIFTLGLHAAIINKNDVWSCTYAYAPPTFIHECYDHPRPAVSAYMQTQTSPATLSSTMVLRSRMITRIWVSR
jgi:hypothetical protein